MVNQKSQILPVDCVWQIEILELFLANKQPNHNVPEERSIGYDKRQALF